MSIWRHVKRWLLPPRTDFYAVADHVRQVPTAELALAEAALAGSGPIGERFVSQLREAPDVWRLIGSDGSYELRVSTRKGIRGIPRAGWSSKPVPARAMPAGRPLEIQLLASSAGVIELHGRMLDGRPWPSTWSIDPADLDRTRRAAPWMSVPTPAEIGATHAGAIEIVEAWLGTPGLLGAKRGVIAIEPPASAEVIAAFEQAQAFDLPPAYRDLLLLADGIEIGSIVVLGTSDAYRLDIPGPNRLVIGAPDEEGAVVLAPSGEVRFVALGDPTSEGRLRAPDLRAWVRTRASSR